MSLALLDSRNVWITINPKPVMWVLSTVFKLSKETILNKIEWLSPKLLAIFCPYTGCDKTSVGICILSYSIHLYPLLFHCISDTIKYQSYNQKAELFNNYYILVEQTWSKYTLWDKQGIQGFVLYIFGLFTSREHMHCAMGQRYFMPTGQDRHVTEKAIWNAES